MSRVMSTGKVLLRWRGGGNADFVKRAPQGRVRLAGVLRFSSSSSSSGAATAVPASGAKGVIVANKEEEKAAKPLGLRDLVSRYGISIAAAYMGVWAATGAGMYMGLNAFGPDAALDILRSTGLGQYVDLNRIDPKLGTAAMTLLLNELAEPVRFPVFLLCIRPVITRYEARLRMRGIDPSAPPAKTSLLGKIKEYGPFGMVYYTGVWAGTGVLTFGFISLFGPELAIDGLHAIGVDKYLDLSSLDPTVGNLAVAVIVNELLEPVRLPLALAALPAAHRWYTGTLRPRLLRLLGKSPS